MYLHRQLRRSCLHNQRTCVAPHATAKLISSGADATVVERRSADVVVLGDSPQGSAAAYALARRGKKVIYLPDMGLQAPQLRAEALKPLLLLHDNLQLASLHNEAVSYLQGLEMQVGVPIMWRTKALDLLPTGVSTREGAALQLAELMQQMADVGKQAGIRFRKVTPADLLTPLPMLRLPNEMAGLMQADGGVINAAVLNAALPTLAGRSGALLRDNLVLQGWQDAGSCFRVRAASRLQPNAVSIFEAEQVLLAPGTWAVDCLRLWGLEFEEVQMQERQALKCGAAPELSRLPLLRVWHSESDARSSSNSTNPATTTAFPDLEPQTVSQPWVLYPPVTSSSASCKLSGQKTQPRTVQTCWELQPDLIPNLNAARALLNQKREINPSQETPQTAALVQQWEQAATLIKGLQGPGLKGREETTSKVQNNPTTAWDMVTPDGMPMLGWHPGFEPGRVLVACTSSTSAKTQNRQDSTAATPNPTPNPNLASHIHTAEQRTTDKSKQRSSPADQTATVEQQQPGRLGSVSVDGYALAPLLAKAASELLLGGALMQVDVDLAKTELTRLGCQASVLDGSWERLDELQLGHAYKQDVLAQLSEEELEALQEVNAAISLGQNLSYSSRKAAGTWIPGKQ